MSRQEVIWTGKSGKRYTYEVHDLNTNWNDVPGNYIFAGLNHRNRWAAAYIGETGSLKDRLSPIESHEKWPCAKRNGATHIHAHVSSSDAKVRRTEESDLIDAYGQKC